MNKKEAAQVLAILKAGYPNHYKTISAEEAQGIISVWSMQFAELPAEVVLMALNKHIATSKYPPTIAEIKGKITSLHWEAEGKLYPLYRYQKTLTEQEQQLYERIYRATEHYKYPDRIEPTIEQLLNKNEVKQIEEGK